MKSKRLVQYHSNSKNMWQYYGEINPGSCGSNCYHYEYDRIAGKIFAVCNACDTDIYVVREEYIKEKLNTGKWYMKDSREV